jgi:hypothetical protein
MATSPLKTEILREDRERYGSLIGVTRDHELVPELLLVGRVSSILTFFM